jgi:Fe2+ transport system protein B
MDDIQLKDQDIAELFNRMPEAKREAIIIAQERMIKELKNQNLEMSKDNLKGVKKVKAEVV